jgi:hypothetical protein
MKTSVRFSLIMLAGFFHATCQEPAAVSKSRVGVALVIGNSKYAQAELPTVREDRAAMAKNLQSLGFDVHEVEDLQRPRDFEDEIRTFLKSEKAAPEDTLVIYYSGHGLQIEGKAYLLGTGITGSGDMSASLREYSIDVDRIVTIMEQAAPAARVLIIDACRNNAFASAPRKAGVAIQRGIEDTYVLFADEPGKTVPARAETSLQSPFTAGLLFAFENSAEGIEKRFEIARAKTRELSPDQNPQLVKSDSSSNRYRPFLDHGGRSAPSQSAGQMLNDSESYYHSGSWRAFQDRIRSALVLSAEPDLSRRLEKENQFAEFVLTAQAAEADPKGSKWVDAARAWQKAGAVFASRPWVLEKSAICWLLADRLTDAVGVLARLQTYTDNPVSGRATQILAGLLQADPSLEAIAKSAVKESSAPSGAEFERYSLKR